MDSWRVLEEQTVQAILQGADKGDADALEFKHWWDLGMTGYDALADAAAKAINDYLKQVDQKCRGECFRCITRTGPAWPTKALRAQWNPADTDGSCR